MQGLKYVIIGLSQNGATLVKIDEKNKFLYFDIKIGTFMDNDEQIKTTKDLLTEQFKFGMKIRKVK